MNTSQLKSNQSSYLFPNDGYVILAFLIIVIGAVAGTVAVESNIPLLRTNFMNNVFAVLFSIIAISILWYYSGKHVSIMGFTLQASYIAYVVIIAILLVIFSG